MNEVDLLDVVDQLIAQHKRLLKRNDMLRKRIDKLFSERVDIEEKLKRAMQTILENLDVEQSKSTVYRKALLFYMSEWNKIQRKKMKNEISLDFQGQKNG